jgi:hypothetical protein
VEGVVLGQVSEHDEDRALENPQRRLEKEGEAVSAPMLPSKCRV